MLRWELYADTLNEHRQGNANVTSSYSIQNRRGQAVKSHLKTGFRLMPAFCSHVLGCCDIGIGSFVPSNASAAENCGSSFQVLLSMVTICIPG